MAAVAGRVTLAIAGVHNAAPAGPFTHVTVTRDYDLATSAPPRGTVYFTPSEWMVNTGVTIVPAARSAALDETGTIAISLVANTDPGTTPADSYYTVREEIDGQPTRTYTMVIPHNVGPVLDLSGITAPSPTGSMGPGFGSTLFGAELFGAGQP
jgi:hypothetical protein